MDPQVLEEKLGADAIPIILDVRSHFEFSSGHIPGARHWPFWKALLFASKVIPDKLSEVVLYCEHGPRAQLVRSVLRGLGYENIVCLRGHMHHWRREKRKLAH